MAWSITPNPDGTWSWSAFQSAYGAASGTAPTFAAAKVELAIAEAAICGTPYPPSVEQAMRADPAWFAADFPDPTTTTREDTPEHGNPRRTGRRCDRDPRP
jgi:hypothetical protein